MSGNKDQLLQMLPEFLANLQEMTVIADTEGMQFDQLDIDLDDLLNQCFILTATWGLSYWERRYLLPDMSHSTDFDIRRSKILEAKSRIRGELLQLLRAIEPNIEFMWNGLTLVFTITQTPKAINFNPRRLIDVLEAEKPAHQNYKLNFIHELAFSNMHHASATISGEAVTMGPRITTEVKTTGIYHHGSTTVTGEVVSMSPRIKTNAEVSGGHHYGSATVSGESLTTTPPVTTQVDVVGAYYQGLVMVSGELVELSPRIITGLESTGQLSKGQISVTGEKIEIYPKGVQ